jgi:glycine oxidase
VLKKNRKGHLNLYLTSSYGVQLKKVVIVGGGLMGMLSALFLKKAGAEVTLFEKNAHTGQESSWAGGGILSPLYPWKYPAAVAELALESQAMYPALADELLAQVGIDPEFRVSGLLMLDVNEIEAGMIWAQKYAQVCEQVDAKRLHDVQPMLDSQFDSGLYFPQIAQVRNPRLAQSVRAYLDKLGVAVHENCPVEQVLASASHIQGVRVNGATINADAVVIAGGAWTGQILAQFGVEREIKPIKGQMLLFKGRSEQIRATTLFEHQYVIARADGHVLVGSTLEDVGFDKSTSTDACDFLLEKAAELFPHLGQLPLVRHWAGLRPGSPHGEPVIGEHPDISGLFINAGHFRNGVVLAPASARKMANIVLEQAEIGAV